MTKSPSGDVARVPPASPHSRPRVLLFLPSMVGIGGTERVVHSLSLLLDQLGYEVFQASLDPPGSVRAFESHIAFFPLGEPLQLPLPVRAVGYIDSAMRLRLLKRRLCVDVVVSNLWRADLVSALAGGGGRRISICHINIQNNYDNRLMMRLLPLTRAVYARMDKVVTVSHALRRELLELLKLEDSEVTCIPNFVTPFAAGPAFPTVPEGAQVLWCGRLHPVKNLRGALSAWARVAPDKRPGTLVVVGGGSDFDASVAFARSLGLKVRLRAEGPEERVDVRFVGEVTNPAPFFRGASALILTSEAEGFGLVIAEAFAAGLPVLAADCPSGAVRELMGGRVDVEGGAMVAEETACGILMPIPRSLDEVTLEPWVSALSQLRDNTARLERWQEGARMRAAEYSAEAAARRWCALLERILRQ